MTQPRPGHKHKQSRCEAAVCLTGKAGVGQHKQSRCEATRQHRPILTGVDGDDTTTQHISRCEANPSVSVFGWWVLCVCQRCNVMTTILSLQEKSRCEATRRGNMAVGLVTHTSTAGVRQQHGSTV